jgi:PhnB protein
MPVAPIPEGFNTITPTLVVSDGKKAIETYVKAFGAKEAYRMEDPNTGKIMHACLQIGTSKLFLCDTNPQCATASSSNFYLYFDNADAIFAQATKAGLKESSAVQDMFWGDRMGSVKDAFGNSWTIATHVRDVSPQELEEAAKKFAEKAKAA